MPPIRQPRAPWAAQARRAARLGAILLSALTGGMVLAGEWGLGDAVVACWLALVAIYLELRDARRDHPGPRP